MAGPVFEFQPHGGDRADDVDAGDPCLEPRRRTVLVIPIKELLGLCQVKAESDTIDGWNHFIEGIAFHLKSSVTLSGYTIGSP